MHQPICEPIRNALHSATDFHQTSCVRLRGHVRTEQLLPHTFLCVCKTTDIPITGFSATSAASSSLVATPLLPGFPVRKPYFRTVSPALAGQREEHSVSKSYPQRRRKNLFYCAKNKFLSWTFRETLVDCLLFLSLRLPAGRRRCSIFSPFSELNLRKNRRTILSSSFSPPPPLIILFSPALPER